MVALFSLIERSTFCYRADNVENKQKSFYYMMFITPGCIENNQVWDHQNYLARQINQNYLARQINQNHLARQINQNYLARQINQNYLARQINKNYLARQINQNHLARQINQNYIAGNINLYTTWIVYSRKTNYNTRKCILSVFEYSQSYFDLSFNIRQQQRKQPEQFKIFSPTKKY